MNKLRLTEETLKKSPGFSAFFHMLENVLLVMKSINEDQKHNWRENDVKGD